MNKSQSTHLSNNNKKSQIPFFFFDMNHKPCLIRPTFIFFD